MDRERAKELLPIIQAFAEGKTIQRNDRIMRDDSLNKWYDTDDITGKGEYRIKPEPRTWYFNIYPNRGKAGSTQFVHITKESATKSADGDVIETVKVREVLDGD